MRVLKVHASDRLEAKAGQHAAGAGAKISVLPISEWELSQSRDEAVGHRKREAMDVPCTASYRIKRVEAGGDQDGYVIGWNDRLGSVAE